VHTPFWQLVPPLQRLPHLPQLALSDCGSTQVAPHTRSPVEQPQTPPVQFAPLAHRRPHMPQSNGFVARSTHALAQSVSGGPDPVVQSTLHCPWAQAGVLALQAFPQAPQLFGSLCVCVQTPLQRRPLAEHSHDPLWHVVPAPQRTPHPPQFALLVLVSTHALSHWARPPLQTHAPPEQDMPAPHARPQAPQLAGSDERLTHRAPHSA
jgi:hypothetical protein